MDKVTFKMGLKRVFVSKKVIISLAGLIASVLVAFGVPVPPGTEALLLKVIAAIVGAFNIGQGLADGLSKGRTSAGRDITTEPWEGPSGPDLIAGGSPLPQQKQSKEGLNEQK